VRGRAMYRGYQMNVRYAEAFEVVKEIEAHFGNQHRELASHQNGGTAHEVRTTDEPAADAIPER